MRSWKWSHFVLLAVFVGAFGKWGLWDATFFGKSVESCAPSFGACWPAVHQNWTLLLAGRYPSEMWLRPLLTSFLVIVFVYLLTLRNLKIGSKALLTLVSVPVLIVVFLGSEWVQKALPAEISHWVAPIQDGRLGGVSLTLFLTYMATLLSFVPGLLLALGRKSEIWTLRQVCTGFVEIVRGMPLITLLFLGHFLFPYFLPPNADPISEVSRLVLCYVLFASAYSSEVWRGAFLTVPKGVSEASASLGLSVFQRMRFVLAPLAFRNALPGLTSNSIGLLKDSSLVATLGVFDLLGVARLIPRQTEWLGKSLEPLFAVSVVYVLLGYCLTKRLQKIEPKWSL